MRPKRTLSTKEFEDITEKLKETSSSPVAEMDTTLDLSAISALDAEFENNFDFDFDDVPVPFPKSTATAFPKRIINSGTRKVTIRIPHRILNVFNEKAAASEKKYQTLMVAALAEASLR